MRISDEERAAIVGRVMDVLAEHCKHVEPAWTDFMIGLHDVANIAVGVVLNELSDDPLF